MNALSIYTRAAGNRRVNVVRKRMSEVVNSTNGKLLSRSVRSILGHPLSKTCFQTSGFTVSSLACLPEITINEDYKWNVWFKALFNAKHEELSNLIVVKKEFEINFLKGNFDCAYNLIIDFEEKFGVTLWGIQSKITVLSISGKSDEAIRYAESITRNNSQYIVKYIIEKLIFKVGVKSISTFTSSMNDIFHEIRATETPYYADFFSTIILPRGYDKKRNPSRGYSTASRFPVCDQYLYFKQALSEKIVDGLRVTDIAGQIAEIRSLIDDANLIRADEFCKGNVQYDQTTLSVLKLYTKGDYFGCVQTIESAWDSDPTLTHYVEIHAKSCAYLKIKAQKESLLYDLSSSMRQSVMVESDCQDNLNCIEDNLVKCYPQEWTLPLFAQLHNLFGTQRSEDGKLYSQINCFGGISTTPKYSFIAMGGTDCGDWCKTTVELLRSVDPGVSIHPSRAVRYDLLSAIQANDETKCINLIDIVDKNSHELLKCEHLGLKSDLLLCRSSHSELVELIASECCENIELYRCFPIKSYVEGVQKDGAGDVDKLLLTIICYIYSKKIDESSLYLLRDAYDDFMDDSGFKKPFFMYKDKSSLTTYEVFFLENVCIPSVMDVSTNFDSSLDVLSKRIQIIDLLARNGISTKDLQKERSSLVDGIVIDKGTVGYDKSRIYVDFNAFTKAKLSEYKSLYSSYLAAQSSGGDQYVLPGLKGRTVLPVGKKEKILHDIIIKFLNDFVRHPEHGLDRSLCAEIRHGYFSNQIRSRFESLHLVTTINEKGDYLQNDYWIKEYNFLNGIILNNIDTLLKEFSSKIDISIAAANEWMRVTFEFEDHIHAFNFSLTAEQFKVISAFLSLTKDFDGFCVEVENFCWERTQDCLSLIQKRLNEEFVSEMNASIDWLAGAIESSRGNIQFSNLVNNIAMAKSGFQEDLNIVTDWFNVTRAYDFGTHDLETLVEISKKCFITMKSNLQINFLGNIDASNFLQKLTDKESRAMITSLITSFDNAIKHGFHPSTPIIVVDCVSSKNTFLIKISNRIKGLSSVQSAALVEALKEKIQEYGDYELMFTEGGTGVYKINSLLNMSSPHFYVDFFCTDNAFTLKINGVYSENISNRRQ